MKRLLQCIATVFLAAGSMSSGASADAIKLAGSLWTCTRAQDGSQFVIAFYPDGGVGGGELERGIVSPYVFDASKTGDDRWPGQWTQTGDNFLWDFPDQHMRVEGQVPAKSNAPLVGTETAQDQKSPVSCTLQTKAPRVGPGLVIPKDGHFLDPEDTEGTLKVPTGISLQPSGRRR